MLDLENGDQCLLQVKVQTYAREKCESKWFFLGIASNSLWLVHRV